MQTDVTILNKVSRNDNASHLDTWFKCEVKGLEYQKKAVTYTLGSAISMGETFTILFPFDDNYVPYEDWKSLTSKTGKYTLSLGDYIVIGKSVSETPTSSNIASIKASYEPNVCEIKAIMEVVENGIATYRFKVEGV